MAEVKETKAHEAQANEGRRSNRTVIEHVEVEQIVENKAQVNEGGENGARPSGHEAHIVEERPEGAQSSVNDAQANKGMENVTEANGNRARAADGRRSNPQNGNRNRGRNYVPRVPWHWALATENDGLPGEVAQVLWNNTLRRALARGRRNGVAPRANGVQGRGNGVQARGRGISPRIRWVNQHGCEVEEPGTPPLTRVIEVRQTTNILMLQQRMNAEELEAEIEEMKEQYGPDHHVIIEHEGYLNSLRNSEEKYTYVTFDKCTTHSYDPI